MLLRETQYVSRAVKKPATVLSLKSTGTSGNVFRTRPAFFLSILWIVVICPEFFYGVRSIFHTTPMLLTILATRLRGWDSQYPILEDVWFFPFLILFWLFLRSKGSNLLVKDSWYHVMSKRSRTHTYFAQVQVLFWYNTTRVDHIKLSNLQSITNHITIKSYFGVFWRPAAVLRPVKCPLPLKISFYMR